MEEVLNQILGEIKNINGEIKNINGEIKNINGEIKNINGRLDRIEEEQQAMKEELENIKESQQVMASRHDEMYLILKAWEEDRPVTKKKLDELNIEMAKMRTHKHKITIDTEKAEAL